MFLAAVVQMNSRTDVDANLRAAEELIRRAAQRGASLVATPESTNFLGPPADKVRLSEPLSGPTCTRLAGLARELGIHLLLGSFNEKADRPERVCNTSVLFGPTGERLAVYRKIHLFDAEVADGAVHRESHSVLPGKDIVAVRTPLACLGLSICFDLRFGEQYEQLRQQGAEVLCVPAAFLTTTGRAHWEVLLRARAIENQCFVLAPGQWGRYEDNGVKESFGHSLIVDPWGQVLAMAADGPGIAVAEIDLERVAQVRHTIPMTRAALPGRTAGEDPTPTRSASEGPAARIGYLLADDLMFTSRVTGTARALGLELATCRNAAELLRRAADRPPACVVLDLHLSGLAVDQVVSALRKDARPYVVGYGSHVQADVLRQARSAGCDLVLPRSQFVAELEQSLPKWFSAERL